MPYIGLSFGYFRYFQNGVLCLWANDTSFFVLSELYSRVTPDSTNMWLVWPSVRVKKKSCPIKWNYLTFLKEDISRMLLSKSGANLSAGLWKGFYFTCFSSGGYITELHFVTSPFLKNCKEGLCKIMEQVLCKFAGVLFDPELVLTPESFKRPYPDPQEFRWRVKFLEVRYI